MPIIKVVVESSGCICCPSVVIDSDEVVGDFMTLMHYVPVVSSANDYGT